MSQDKGRMRHYTWITFPLCYSEGPVKRWIRQTLGQRSVRQTGLVSPREALPTMVFFVLNALLGSVLAAWSFSNDQAPVISLFLTLLAAVGWLVYFLSLAANEWQKQVYEIARARREWYNEELDENEHSLIRGVTSPA